jgi:glycosyltransferase involved in cell wall biosynthesis
MSRPHISVVVPVYECSGCLTELHRRLDASLAEVSDDYEIILVNDASVDASWDDIQALAVADRRVKGLDLSRNFGQHHAIAAGLDYARGDWVVVMDCDLQDRPEEIPNLYRKAQGEFDMVVGVRSHRQDSIWKKTTSRLFFGVFAYFTGSPINHRVGNFGIYSREVVRSIRRLKEQNRSFGLFAVWVGFRRAELEVEHAKRASGQTSYSFSALMRLAMDSIIAHSDKLLRLAVRLGLFMSSCSLLFSLWLVILYFGLDRPVPGWTSVMVSVYFTAGLVIGVIGIVGLYVGKIFDEVKGRPLYVIRSTTFEDTQAEN